MSYERVIDDAPIADRLGASPYGGDVLAAKGMWQDDVAAGIWQDHMDRAINRISPVPSAWSRVLEPFNAMTSDLGQIESDLEMIAVKCLALECLDEIASAVDAMGGDFKLGPNGMMRWNEKVSEHQFGTIMLNVCLDLISHYASIEYAATQHTTVVISEMDRNYWVCSCGDRSEIGFPAPHIADSEGLRHILLAAQEIRISHGE